ncbi:FTR1 family iron permease [Paenibacillus glycanilyticus]|uniref:Iron permease n=1 Tax=Paenibacillus glycanilyticus TaxID=126569 RepID=A0ABQ6G7L2_9BACL|nr:FTR1 family protein [Paenibacillus glycanilyticus]GLX66934.1 hypothetical protein MU1_12780 [Paenibacillus glycanilyticus]
MPRLVLIIFIFALLCWNSGTLFASDQLSGAQGNDPKTYMSNLVTDLENKDLEKAYEDLAIIKKWWSSNKTAVKQDSIDMALEIDRQIASLSLAFLNKDAAQASEIAGTLQFSLNNYSDGAYISNSGKSAMTLETYIVKLQKVGNLLEKQNWLEAQKEVKLLQREWLSVEGDVVSQSQTKYNNAERDLVLLDANLNNREKQNQAIQVVERLIQSLTPLLDAQYSWWDAALIPLREGLEGLLVVGTLLMYTKRSQSTLANRWIIGGAAAALLVCLVVGVIVSLLLSSSTFGHNNTLINGWTGVIASVMLLYVSYWLHRNSDVKRWNQFLQAQSNKALTSGRMISFALLAFFAIVREGLETVIFLVGMVGKMSNVALSAGIIAGFGILAICAVVMIKAGTRLPIRPVFLVSSLIVFYLCFKFIGSGIHSLQMAGVIPSTMQDYLPERMALSIYPSWYSFLPQLVFVLAAIAIWLYQKLGSTRYSKNRTII